MERGPVSGAREARDPVAHFLWLIGETERRLRLNGIPPELVSEGFVEYHLTHGRTPEEIVDVAIGTRRRRHDAHLGGIDA